MFIILYTFKKNCFVFLVKYVIIDKKGVIL